MVLMSTLHTVLHLQPAQIGVAFSTAAARSPSPRLQLMQDAARYAAVDDLDAWVRASGGSGRFRAAAAVCGVTTGTPPGPAATRSSPSQLSMRGREIGETHVGVVPNMAESWRFGSSIVRVRRRAARAGDRL